MLPPDPQSLRDLMPFAVLLDIELVEATADVVVGRIAWAPERCTTGTTMHGGAVMSLADTCGGACAFLNMPEGATGTATIESKTNFLRPITEGSATATSRPLHRGRILAVIETEVTREDGKLATKVTQTQTYFYPAP
jgi:uncharacterized protein (TIGR00369 family)